MNSVCQDTSAPEQRFDALRSNPIKIARHVSIIQNTRIRAVLGLLLLVSSSAAAVAIHGQGRIGSIAIAIVSAWLPSVFFTDKYVHKYPQRYGSYLIASHLKAAVIMAFFVWLLDLFTYPASAPGEVLWTAYAFFIILDFLVSTPRKKENRNRPSTPAALGHAAENRSCDPVPTEAVFASLNMDGVMNKISAGLDTPFLEFIKGRVRQDGNGSRNIRILDDIPRTDDPAHSMPVDLLVGRTRINDVLRLNRFMLYCASRIQMGGYFALRYTPLENVTKRLKSRYSGILYYFAFALHYLWYRAIPKIPWLDALYFSPALSWLDTILLSIVKRRNRALSKAEVWGRLSYCGMSVLAESTGDDERFVMAQRIALPVEGKMPSYYPVVKLEKVGLDGVIIHTHKIRTMFPFSEFLQKRVFEDHGLAATGKFSNDFRLTEIGKFLRKYWLDELPQIYDWLRGDVKLVGMRATSPHFLSLYPKEVYDLYVQIKPGLIPPIFDESVTRFDQIVDVELSYLRSYLENPFRTDVQYFIKTFTDIFFKGVRSR